MRGLAFAHWILLASGQFKPTRVAARNKILQLISKEPGIPLTELATRLGHSGTSISRHVAALEQEGLVRTRIAGRRRIAYPGAPPLAEDPRDRALLQEATSRRIALAIVAHAGEDIARLATRLHLSKRVVYHHVKRLVEAGLVSSAQGYEELDATPALLALLGPAP